MDGATSEPAARGKSLSRSDRSTGVVMLLPAFIVIGVVTLFPIIYSVAMSLNNISLTQNGFAMQFAGLANYDKIVRSGEFWHSVWFTVYYAIVTVIAELVIGMLIALAINNVEKLKNISLVVMLIPWSLITVISAQMWAYIYNGVYGVLNYIFRDCISSVRQ